MMAGLQAQIANSIGASRGQMEAFASSQKNFLDAQNDLLKQALAANKAAQTSAEDLNAQATTVASQLRQQKEQAERTIASANGAVEVAKQKLDEVNTKLSSVKSLQDLSLELARTQAADIVTLGDRQTTEIRVRNIGALGDDQSKPTRYRITFKVGDMKRSFDIEYKIESEEQLAQGVEGQWKRWHITPRNSSSSSSFISCVSLAPATFQANLTQKYSGFFAPEFVVIRIIPRDTTEQPCGMGQVAVY